RRVVRGIARRLRDLQVGDRTILEDPEADLDLHVGRRAGVDPRVADPREHLVVVQEKLRAAELTRAAATRADAEAAVRIWRVGAADAAAAAHLPARRARRVGGSLARAPL